MRGKLFLTLFLLMVCSGFVKQGSLAAQSRPAQGRPAPQGREASAYVTQIKAEARNNLIRLTWVDSPEAQGPVYIFRSARPFFGSIPANIRPVVVKYGEQYYVDETDDMENIFYFIAASDMSGLRHDVILPQINSTSVNVNIAQPAQPGEQPPAQAELRLFIPPEQKIWNIRAREDGERIIVTYDTAEPDRRAVLYRSTQPVRRPQDLLNAVLLRSGVKPPFVDLPVPGITWYYAVIYEDEISSGGMGINPGYNSTITGARVGETAAEASMRPMPLPILDLRSAVRGGFVLPEPPEQTPLSREAAGMLGSTRPSAKVPLVLKTPRVFTVDLSAPSSGEESALSQIINDHFLSLDWESACVALQHYLSLPRSQEVEVRARFYFGQTLYFTGNYRQAFLEFLTIRSANPIEINAWLDAVLTAMVY